MEKSKIEFPEERRFDMLVGALEGGSNYWYWIGKKANKIIDEKLVGEPEDKDGTPYASAMWKAILKGASIPIHDIEITIEDSTPPTDKGKPVRKKLGEISLKSIAEGEEIMFAKYRHNYARILTEDDDAGDSDVWFQLAVMKEVVYG